MDQHVGKRAKRKWVSAICEWLEVPFWSGQSIINPKRISHFPFAFPPLIESPNRTALFRPACVGADRDGLKGSRFSQLYQLAVTLHRPYANFRFASHSKSSFALPEIEQPRRSAIHLSAPPLLDDGHQSRQAVHAAHAIGETPGGGLTPNFEYQLTKAAQHDGVPPIIVGSFRNQSERARGDARLTRQNPFVWTAKTMA